MSLTQLIGVIGHLGRRPIIKSKSNTQLNNLIYSCLSRDPSHRPDFTSILKVFNKIENTKSNEKEDYLEEFFK